LNEVLRQAMFREFVGVKSFHKESMLVSEYLGFYD
jgi:hypothetical protein